MTERSGKRVSLAWSRSDCLGLTVLLAIWIVALGAASLAPRIRLGSPAIVDRARAESVRETIDPNTADAASLRRLPMIGPERASAMVQFRQAVASRTPSRPAKVFEFVEDLRRVRGIGPGIAARVAPFLALPARTGATQGVGDRQ